MERIEVIGVSRPRHGVDDTDTITLDVKFAHLSEPVPFTARKDDTEEYGRELYSRAVFGEFGPIEVISPPPPTEDAQQARISEALARAAIAIAPLEDADKLGIINKHEKDRLTALQHYRVTLYRLPQSVGWPAKVTFPDEPL